MRGGGRAGVEDARQFHLPDGRDLIVVAAGDAFGRSPSEKSADQAATRRDTVREFLVDEGASQQHARARIGLVIWIRIARRNKEAKARRDWELRRICI